MIPPTLNILGGIFNCVAALIVLYAAIRNYMIHAENVSLIDKIEGAMKLMLELRDMLAEEQRDPFDAGNDRQKEVRH
jgi:hypothetical protein